MCQPTDAETILEKISVIEALRVSRQPLEMSEMDDAALELRIQALMKLQMVYGCIGTGLLLFFTTVMALIDRYHVPGDQAVFGACLLAIFASLCAIFLAVEKGCETARSCRAQARLCHLRAILRVAGDRVIADLHALQNKP